MTREEFIIRLTAEILLNNNNIEVEDKFNWIAMDEGGNYYLYTQKPVIPEITLKYNNNEWIHNVIEKKNNFELLSFEHESIDINLETDINWKDTLVSIEELLSS